MKFNKKNIITGIIILVLLILLCLKQCGCGGNTGNKSLENNTPTIIDSSKKKTDTILKIVKEKIHTKDTLFKEKIVIKRDTIIDSKSIQIIDSLKNLLLASNKRYEATIEEINALRSNQQQKQDSLKMLLGLLQKAMLGPTTDKQEEIKNPTAIEIFFIPKNILFTGIFTDQKTNAEVKTIYAGLLKKVLLSVDFLSNMPITPDNRKQRVYIKISNIETEDLLYVTDSKPTDKYTLANGDKISYSLESDIILNDKNMANLKITYPIKWSIKRNSAIKVEVFHNKQKIGENINEIKSGIPVTTW